MAAPGRKNVDDALVLELAAGKSISSAAFMAGCSERTVRRRLADPAFRARVNESRSELVSQAVGKLSQLGGLASDTLRDLLAAKSEAVRLGAARSILDSMFHGIEMDALARQLADLKQQVEEMRSHEPGSPPPRPDPPPETDGGTDNPDSGAGPAGSDPPRPRPYPPGGADGAGQVAI